MKEQIIKILESYIVDNIGETSPKIDIDAIPTIADEILALQLQQTGVIKSFYCNSEATLEKRCDKQCSWCNSYEMIME